MKGFVQLREGAVAAVTLAILLSIGLTAFGSPLQENSERLIARCRTMATSGNRAEAILQLQSFLVISDNSDARVLLGQALSWEGRYDEARKELQLVLAKTQDHGDALPALINVELWSGHPERAADLVNDVLRRKPQEKAFLLANVRVLRALNDPKQARDAVRRLLEVDPANTDALQLRKDLFEQGHALESAVSQSVEWFNDGTKPWHESQVSLKRESAAGTLIARFSQAERFSLTSRQSEVEFYPRIRPGTYMYLAGGYSNDRQLYPHLRGGAELFQSVGKGIELSAGLQTMAFAERVNIYTGSVAKYKGSWYCSLRTYLTPGNTGVSRSFQFQARRYLGSSGLDYVAFRVGQGSSPVEVRNFQDTTILKLLSFGVDYYRRIGRVITLSARTGMSREDRVYRTELLRSYADLGVGFRF